MKIIALRGMNALFFYLGKSGTLSSCFILVVLVVFACSCVYVNGISEQYPLSVTVPDDFPTIQAAINTVPEGSTVVVKNGTYVGSILIDKALRVIGREGDKVTLKGVPGEDVVGIRANSVTFSGFEVEGAAESQSAGIRLSQSNHGEISNNRIYGNGLGLFIWDSSNMTLRGNSIYGNRRNLGVWGLFLEHFLHDIDSSNNVESKPVYYWTNKQNVTVPADAGYVAIINSTSVAVRDLWLSDNFDGLLAAYTTSSIIQNVTCVNNDYGVHLLASRENTISQSNLSSCSTGLLLDLSQHNYVTENAILRNVRGIMLSYSPLKPDRSDGNNVTGNTIAHNTDGILLINGANNTFQDNEILQNSRSGVLASFSLQNMFKRNSFLSNNHGLILERSGENVVYNNNFVSNSFSVSTDTSVNFWNQSSDFGGNYWDDNSHVDENEDGIVDSPYVINQLNIDSLPLAGFFSSHIARLKGKEYLISLISNSTSWAVDFSEHDTMLNANISTSDGSVGFCRLSIPLGLAKEVWGNDTAVLLDNSAANSTRTWQSDEMLHLYLTYPDLDHQIVIISEYPAFPFFAALALFLLTPLVLVRRLKSRVHW